MNVNRKDLASGAIFCTIGAFYMVYALRTLSFGEAFNMGPGYFPVVLSGIVIGLGIIVAARSFFVLQTSPFGVVPWRAVILISLALLFFAVSVRPLGIGLSVYGTVLLACAASPQIRLRAALVTALGVAVFCWLVFSVGVGMPVPLFGRWFEGTPLSQVEAPLREMVLFIFSLPRMVAQFLAEAIGS